MAKNRALKVARIMGRALCDDRNAAVQPCSEEGEQCMRGRLISLMEDSSTNGDRGKRLKRALKAVRIPSNNPSPIC